MSSSYTNGDPVVFRRVLVGFEEDGVALAGVYVNVVDGEGVEVVAVCFHHRHLVVLHEQILMKKNQSNNQFIINFLNTNNAK